MRVFYQRLLAPQVAEQGRFASQSRDPYENGPGATGRPALHASRTRRAVGRQVGTTTVAPTQRAVPTVAFVLPIGKIIAVVVILGGAAAAWFLVGAPLTAKLAIREAYAPVLRGDLV